jgi:hypothetical protein
MDARTNDPDSLVDLGRNRGDQKCLRRLNYVRKLHRALPSLAFSKSARNWLAPRDDF